jgi:hypothetical protein
MNFDHLGPLEEVGLPPNKRHPATKFVEEMDGEYIIGGSYRQIGRPSNLIHSSSHKPTEDPGVMGPTVTGTSVTGVKSNTF